MLKPKQIGNLVELQCITCFYELGYAVSIPFGENSRYDFIADIDGKLLRIQCKSASSNDDGASIKISCRSSKSNSSGCISRRYTEKEIDYFCTYYDKQCYIIPISECSTEKRLRLIESKNAQKEGINYANEYEIKSQLEKLKRKG